MVHRDTVWTHSLSDSPLMLSSRSTGVSGMMLGGSLFLRFTSNFSNPGAKKKGELLPENRRKILAPLSGRCTIDPVRVETSSSEHFLPGTFRLKPNQWRR